MLLEALTTESRPPATLPSNSTKTYIRNLTSTPTPPSTNEASRPSTSPTYRIAHNLIAALEINLAVSRPPPPKRVANPPQNPPWITHETLVPGSSSTTLVVLSAWVYVLSPFDLVLPYTWVPSLTQGLAYCAQTGHRRYDMARHQRLQKLSLRRTKNRRHHGHQNASTCPRWKLWRVGRLVLYI